MSKLKLKSTTDFKTPEGKDFILASSLRSKVQYPAKRVVKTDELPLKAQIHRKDQGLK